MSVRLSTQLGYQTAFLYRMETLVSVHTLGLVVILVRSGHQLGLNLHNLATELLQGVDPDGIHHTIHLFMIFGDCLVQTVPSPLPLKCPTLPFASHRNSSPHPYINTKVSNCTF